jgi:hypothetical protein
MEGEPQIGHGSAVLRWLERAASDRGRATIRGLVRRENLVGLAFARYCGYAIEKMDEQPDHVIAWKSI